MNIPPRIAVVYRKHYDGTEGPQWWTQEDLHIELNYILPRGLYGFA